jgi:hypothetical protein
VGNYASGDSYLAVGLDAVGGTIFLQAEWQSFRRDFGGVPPARGQELVPGAVFDPDRFNAVFRVGRLLHITNQQGNHFFVRITGTAPNQAAVSFAPPLGVGGPGVGGLAGGSEVAPLSRIRYMVTNFDGPGDWDALLPASGQAETQQDARGLANAFLVRQELDGNNNVMTDAQGGRLERIVLEYVANVDYRFVLDLALPGMPPQLLEGGGENGQINNLLGDVRLGMVPQPQALRSVIVSLSARTPEQDPRFAWVEGAQGNPATGLAPTRYRVNPDLPGAARVRTLRSEIQLPNVAP